MNMKKVLALALALVLIVGATVAGTVAWLMDKTENVTNTFTVGNINIDLKEHELDSVTNVLESNEVISEDEYKILPGTSQPKDPFVTIEKDSEDCYVFVQIKEVNNYDPKYIDWAIADGWKLLETTNANTDNTIYTYYRADNYDGPNEAVYNVLACPANTDYTNGGVKYPDTLVKADLDALYKTQTNDSGTPDDTSDDVHETVVDSTKQPQLIFKAFAVQVEAGDVDAAWAAVDAGEKLTA